jgi:ribonuclease D
MSTDARGAAVPYVCRGDLPAEVATAYGSARRLAWDVETTGLDWRQDRLATCQLFADSVGVSIVSITEKKAPHLIALLENPAVEKVFHHAPFDLRFMAHAWDAQPASIRCTKVASKLLQPEAPQEAHSLGSLVAQHLGVRLEKGPVRTSDWLALDLTGEQIAYAAGDVLHLLQLLDVLEGALDAAGLGWLYDACCAFLPAHARLQTGGYPDVFSY